MNPEKMTTSLSLLVIRSSDIDRLKAFYEALGCSFVKEQHGKGPVHYAADFGGFVLEIYPQPVKASTDRFSLRLGFRVQDLPEVLSRVVANGGKLIQHLQESPWGYRVIVCDPDGRKIELVEV